MASIHSIAVLYVPIGNGNLSSTPGVGVSMSTPGKLVVIVTSPRSPIGFISAFKSSGLYPAPRKASFNALASARGASTAIT